MKKGNIIIAVLTVLLVSLIGIAVVYPSSQANNNLKRFSSYEELENYVKTNTESYSGGFYDTRMETTTVPAATGATKQVAESATPSPSVSDYSKTNIQVEGVDEADIVKNDGRYIYTVSGKEIVIVDAYPAENAKIISKIELNGTPQEIFLNKDKLIVFGWEDYYTQETAASKIGIMPPRYYTQQTFIRVYDITDRSNPILKRTIMIDGNYYDSRMIGDYVYAIVNKNVEMVGTEPISMPMVKSNDMIETVKASDVYYFDYPDSSYIFTNVVSLNTQNDVEDVTTKTFLMGYSENMYVSPTNIYVVYTRRLNEYDFYDKIIDDVIIPAVPSETQGKIEEVRNSNVSKYEKMQEIGKLFNDYMKSLGPEVGAIEMKRAEEKMKTVREEISKQMEKTIIHKISIDNGRIEYITNGEVPGYVLNQFSMDEQGDNFRIATTTGNWRAESLNHVYVLDGNLQVVGKLEDLAHGERIYSVRFIGNKGYMVTFRQIDPLFVIDLSDPTNPKVLGYLKIPGVSEYLHPYDENHVIGVGRDATEEGRVKGLKLSLFDVSDVSNPKEVSKYIIGESGTYSEALNDHKAFLFSITKNLLVIPVSLAEKNYQQDWYGAFVFNLDLNNGFVLKGRITHSDETNKTEYYYDYQSQIRRSLYIDNVLYTISSKMVKMNDLSSLLEINKVDLPYENERIYPLIE